MSIDRYTYIFWGIDLGLEEQVSWDIREAYCDGDMDICEHVEVIHYGCGMSGNKQGFALALKGEVIMHSGDDDDVGCQELNPIQKEKTVAFLEELRSMGYEFDIDPAWHVAGEIN